MTPTKKCTKCGNDFEINSDNFRKQKSSKDGFSYFCKGCSRILDAAIYLKNRDIYISRALEQKKKNKEIN